MAIPTGARRPHLDLDLDPVTNSGGGGDVDVVRTRGTKGGSKTTPIPSSARREDADADNAVKAGEVTGIPSDAAVVVVVAGKAKRSKVDNETEKTKKADETNVNVNAKAAAAEGRTGVEEEVGANCCFGDAGRKCRRRSLSPGSELTTAEKVGGPVRSVDLVCSFRVRGETRRIMRAPGSRARRSAARPSDAPPRRDSLVPQGLGVQYNAMS